LFVIHARPLTDREKRRWPAEAEVTKKTKEYWNMTAAELAEATSEFDREFVADTFRDMTAAEEKAWRTAVGKRRKGRKGAANGVKIVPLGIDASLLKRADALAKKRGVSRDCLVAEGLETLLAHGRKRA
jgi:hypothetical protein